jgi:RNA polymerase sigma factor for flagellar operon FliA
MPREATARKQPRQTEVSPNVSVPAVKLLASVPAPIAAVPDAVAGVPEPIDELAQTTEYVLTHDEVAPPPSTNTRPKIDPTKYLDFVRRIATRMARNLPSHVSLDDLIGAGTLGLIDAMDRYDPKKAERFETFAEFRIKGAILDELRRYDLMARNARLTAKRLARKTQELTARLGRPPSDAEVASSMDMSQADYRKLVDRVGNVRVLSLDDLVSPEDKAGDRCFELSSKALGPDELTSMREMQDRLRDAIAGLPERQQMILEMYYQREMTLKEIGLHVGVTESRVCQIMGEATGKLRNILKSERERGQ